MSLSIEKVIAIVTVQGVIAVLSNEIVSARTAIEHVIAIIAVDAAIVARTAVSSIVTTL